MLGLAVAAMAWGIWGFAGQAAPKRYDPDPQACKMDMIRTSYRNNLLPWLDQPEGVQQRLRLLQASMTLDTLRECQAKGLLNPQQVTSLIQELGLKAGPGDGASGPSDAQSPTRP